MTETTPTTGKLAEALAAAQAEIRDPARNKRGQVRGRNDYTYAGLDDTLAVMRAVLPKHGLAVSQFTVMVEGKVGLRSMLMHSSGEALVSFYPLGWAGTPQDHGSEITYARRYSLEALLGVAATDDDDGDAASNPTTKARGKGKPKAEHHPTWAKSQPGFMAEIARLGMTYDNVAALCESRGNPRPSALPVDDLRDLLRWLRTDGGPVYRAAYPDAQAGGDL